MAMNLRNDLVLVIKLVLNRRLCNYIMHQALWGCSNRFVASEFGQAGVVNYEVRKSYNFIVQRERLNTPLKI